MFDLLDCGKIKDWVKCDKVKGHSGAHSGLKRVYWEKGNLGILDHLKGIKENLKK